MLDEATGKWGIRVNRVEIKSVDPPPDIKEAMEKQMRAERDRRAAILTAEGTKQAAILTAEGEQRAAVLTAEGARQAAILRAEGEAKAIATVFSAIHAGDADHKLLAYQYLQMLPKLAEGEANKVFVIPSEFTQAFAGIGDALSRRQPPTARRRRPAPSRRSPHAGARDRIRPELTRSPCAATVGRSGCWRPVATALERRCIRRERAVLEIGPAGQRIAMPSAAPRGIDHPRDRRERASSRERFGASADRSSCASARRCDARADGLASPPTDPASRRAAEAQRPADRRRNTLRSGRSSIRRAAATSGARWPCPSTRS